mmetsp:Transcript_10240/g.20908  ORF Transcript_10240/g.20908 Transcript_10240/m.20908 type:complete len:297 (+) Transcript_10240:837-1727(+)
MGHSRLAPLVLPSPGRPTYLARAGGGKREQRDSAPSPHRAGRWRGRCRHFGRRGGRRSVLLRRRWKRTSAQAGSPRPVEHSRRAAADRGDAVAAPLSGAAALQADRVSGAPRSVQHPCRRLLGLGHCRRIRPSSKKLSQSGRAPAFRAGGAGPRAPRGQVEHPRRALARHDPSPARHLGSLDPRRPAGGAAEQLSDILWAPHLGHRARLAQSRPIRRSRFQRRLHAAALGGLPSTLLAHCVPLRALQCRPHRAAFLKLEAGRLQIWVSALGSLVLLPPVQRCAQVWLLEASQHHQR